MKRKALVLLVAADGLTRRLTTNGLEIYGYEVIAACNGAEAVALLQSERRVGILVTDAELGGETDGLAVAQAGRAIDPGMIVIYTARSPHMIPAKRKVSAAPTVRAPFHPHQLLGVISQLRQGPAEDGAEAA
jgi:DNA-binding NtrC family response regulator